MAMKTSVVVLLSFNLLFFATLSSSSALPPAASAPQPSSCPIDIRDLRVCETTLVALARSPGRIKDPGLKGNIDQCCEVIFRVDHICVDVWRGPRGADEPLTDLRILKEYFEAAIRSFNHDMIGPLNDLINECHVFDVVVQPEPADKYSCCHN